MMSDKVKARNVHVVGVGESLYDGQHVNDEFEPCFRFVIGIRNFWQSLG